jgi:hypothetical protein
MVKKQFENNQEPQGMRMKCRYLLREQIVNTDGMVSDGNSTFSEEVPVNAAIRPVVLFPEELVTVKILVRVVLLTVNHVKPSTLVSMKYEVTH